MKNLLLIVFLAANFIFADNVKSNSTLTNVTVYLNEAQITRISNINLPIGTTEFTFGKFSPYIRKSSIQISVLKKASILSINYGIKYLSKQDHSVEYSNEKLIYHLKKPKNISSRTL